MTRGKEFELLTKSIFEKLSENSKFESVEHNVKLEGKDGPRQIDVLISAKVAGMELKTIIECKDYKSKISVGKIDALHSVMQDVNANKAVLVSKSGFSSTAMKKAKRLGISLYTAHEALKSSWTIDIEYPVTVKEITPIKVIPKFQANFERGDTFHKDSVYQINDMNVIDEFQKQWVATFDNDSVYEPGKHYDITVDTIKPPHYIRTSNGDKHYISDLSISFMVEVECFSGYLNEQENTQVLQDVLENETKVFVDLDNLIQYRDKLKKTDLLDFSSGSSFALNCVSKPKIQFLGGDINITKVD